MKLLIFLLAAGFVSCQPTTNENTESGNQGKPIIGTWKLVYADIKENDSVTVKDMTKAEFIKIINATHFAFFNQSLEDDQDFYGGAGTYALNGSEYVESLDYIRNVNLRGHLFDFTLEVKGDSLIQTGLEDVPAAGLKRYITEKYVRIKP